LRVCGVSFQRDAIAAAIDGRGGRSVDFQGHIGVPVYHAERRLGRGNGRTVQVSTLRSVRRWERPPRLTSCPKTGPGLLAPILLVKPTGADGALLGPQRGLGIWTSSGLNLLDLAWKVPHRKTWRWGDLGKRVPDCPRRVPEQPPDGWGAGQSRGSFSRLRWGDRRATGEAGESARLFSGSGREVEPVGCTPFSGGANRCDPQNRQTRNNRKPNSAAVFRL
jgi:hypothetical protein